MERTGWAGEWAGRLSRKRTPGLSGRPSPQVVQGFGLCMEPPPQPPWRMLRGARPHPGVALLEGGQPPQEAEARTRAVGRAEAARSMGNTAPLHL